MDGAGNYPNMDSLSLNGSLNGSFSAGNGSYNGPHHTPVVPPAGATVSVTATTRMKTYSSPHMVPQQTRHARRIYVGGVPPNYIDEDGLRDFFNAVIAQGLHEENDYSYVLSVYVDQKKCFSFVELKSIELATACLALDGIVMKNIVLRILRANEYKPELVQQHVLNGKNVTLDLSGLQFGVPNTSSLPGGDSGEAANDKTLDALIQYNNLDVLDAGSIIIVGYPYDESSKKPSSGHTTSRSSSSSSSTSSLISTTHTPRMLRHTLRTHKYGCVENSEYGVSLSALRVLDIGDVCVGKTVDETRVNLVTTVSELVVRAGVPVVIGGSSELIYSSVSGLMTVCGGDVSALCVSSRLHTRLLDDSRFCRLASSSAVHPSCDGRFVLFGAQGSRLCQDEAKFIENRNGRVLYLSRDLRANPSKSVAAHFEETLQSLSALTCKESRQPLRTRPSQSDMLHTEADDLDSITDNGALATTPSGGVVGAPPIVVCFDAGVLAAHYLGSGSGTSSAALGLHFEELVEMARLAGKNPLVSMLTITDFACSPSEDTRTHLLVAELLYFFLLGFAERSAATNNNNNNNTPTAVPSHVLYNTYEEVEEPGYLRGPFNCATRMCESDGVCVRESNSVSVAPSLSHSHSFSLDRSLSNSLSAQSLLSLSHNNNNNNTPLSHNTSQRERAGVRASATFSQPSHTTHTPHNPLSQHAHHSSHRSISSPAHSTHSLLTPHHSSHGLHSALSYNNNNTTQPSQQHTLSHNALSQHALASRSSSYYNSHTPHNAPTQPPPPPSVNTNTATHNTHTQQSSLYRGLSSHSSSFYFNNSTPNNVNRINDVHSFDEALDLCGDHTTPSHNTSGYYSVVPPHNSFTQASAADFGLRPEYH